MPTTPSPPLFSLFVQAAQKHGISHAFLLAVADAESGLDASKVDRSHYVGSAIDLTRRGIFQLSDQQIEELQIADPTDPAQQLEAVGGMFASLKEMSEGSAYWDVMAGIFYFARMGKGEYPSSLLAGSARFHNYCQGANADHWPNPPHDYAIKIRESRKVYQDVGKPIGNNALEQLRNAVANMRELYPGMQPSLAKLEADLSEYNANKQTPQYADYDPGNLELHSLWFDYSNFFDQVPYTDASTPAPWRMEPSIKKVELPGVELAQKAAEKAGEALGKLDEYVLIGLGIAGALGALWVVVNRKRS